MSSNDKEIEESLSKLIISEEIYLKTKQINFTVHTSDRWDINT